MLSTKVIDPKELGQDERDTLQEMATWRYAEFFDRKAIDSHLLVGLYDGEKPRGLAVIRISYAERVCNIDHHFLDPSIDELEGLQRLFHQIYEWVEENDFRLLSIAYPLTAENGTLGKYLDADGWTEGTPMQKQYLYEVKLFSPKWYRKQIPLPQDFTILPWAELTESHKSSLEATIKGAGVPHYLTPNYYQKYLLEHNTLILLHHERAIGWAVTHTFPDSPDTVEYSSLFVHPLYRYHGYSIRLLADAIRIHFYSGIKYGLFKLSLSESSSNWKRFIERHLEPNSQQNFTVVKRIKLFDITR